ncbi:MAG TPA: tagaturonate epimerase family protein [Bryobacterales bacterium]|nr:tagaturonate epimerase family protein [Bryobacterales bacterium]
MNEFFQQIGTFLQANVAGRELNDEVRSEAARTGPQPPAGRAYYLSLTRDPVAADIHYVAVDLDGSWLLRSTPGGVDALPFSSADWSVIRRFAENIDPSFLPRPQKDQPAVAVGNRHPEISLPAAFDAFGRILRSKCVNMASTVQLSATREMTTAARLAGRTGENPTEVGHTRVSIEHLYHAGLWAAIRAGWRHGYNAEADHFIISGASGAEIAHSIEQTKAAIRAAAGYTKFTTDTSRLFRLEADPRHPHAWSDAQVEQEFERILNREQQRWVLSEFGRSFSIEGRVYSFTPAEIRRLAVKFSQSLQLNEDLYDYIQQAKRESGRSTDFDFEPSIDEAETLTTAREMIFYMHWLASRGRRAQLVPPNLGFKKRQAYPETAAALREYAAHKMWPELLPRVEREFGGDPVKELGARVRELADVARYFNGTLSIHSGSGKQARVLQMIGRSTGGRVNYKISGELQLQLLDVLSEQPAGSPWRSLFERMVDRCVQFAEAGAFGEESQLARIYKEKGLGYYLGDRLKGRVDGNLFLVFWLGNLVGSRDAADPSGDHRFFKEKLDELPAALVQEVQRRNSDYIVWLAEQLRP